MWQTDLRKVAMRDPPMWGFCSSRLVTNSLVIVHAGDKVALVLLPGAARCIEGLICATNTVKVSDLPFCRFSAMLILCLHCPNAMDFGLHSLHCVEAILLNYLSFTFLMHAAPVAPNRSDPGSGPSSHEIASEIPSPTMGPRPIGHGNYRMPVRL